MFSDGGLSALDHCHIAPPQTGKRHISIATNVIPPETRTMWRGNHPRRCKRVAAASPWLSRCVGGGGVSFGGPEGPEEGGRGGGARVGEGPPGAAHNGRVGRAGGQAVASGPPRGSTSFACLLATRKLERPPSPPRGVPRGPSNREMNFCVPKWKWDLNRAFLADGGQKNIQKLLKNEQVLDASIFLSRSWEIFALNSSDRRPPRPESNRFPKLESLQSSTERERESGKMEWKMRSARNLKLVKVSFGSESHTLIQFDWKSGGREGLLQSATDARKIGRCQQRRG